MGNKYAKYLAAVCAASMAVSAFAQTPITYIDAESSALSESGFADGNNLYFRGNGVESMTLTIDKDANARELSIWGGKIATISYDAGKTFFAEYLNSGKVDSSTSHIGEGSWGSDKLHVSGGSGEINFGVNATLSTITNNATTSLNFVKVGSNVLTLGGNAVFSGAGKITISGEVNYTRGTDGRFRYKLANNANLVLNSDTQLREVVFERSASGQSGTVYLEGTQNAHRIYVSTGITLVVNSDSLVDAGDAIWANGGTVRFDKSKQLSKQVWFSAANSTLIYNQRDINARFKAWALGSKIYFNERTRVSFNAFTVAKGANSVQYFLGDMKEGDDYLVTFDHLMTKGENDNYFETDTLSKDGLNFKIVFFNFANGKVMLKNGLLNDEDSQNIVAYTGSDESGTALGNFYWDSETKYLMSRDAVPEPATYAAVFGLAALGFALYRRRRQC